MSFYVETQQEALQIGLGYFRPDLAKLSIEELKNHPDVTVTTKKIRNPLDFEGKFVFDSLTLDIKELPVLIASSPFRTGYDVWVISRESGFGHRVG